LQSCPSKRFRPYPCAVFNRWFGVELIEQQHHLRQPVAEVADGDRRKAFVIRYKRSSGGSTVVGTQLYEQGQGCLGGGLRFRGLGFERLAWSAVQLSIVDTYVKSRHPAATVIGYRHSQG